jgi:hypothetical protein
MFFASYCKIKNIFARLFLTNELVSIHIIAIYSRQAFLKCVRMVYGLGLGQTVLSQEENGLFL